MQLDPRVKKFMSGEEVSKRYQMLEWGGSSNSKSKILDIVRNKEIIIVYNHFRNCLKNNIDYIFFEDKEKIYEKRKATNQKKYGVDNICQLQETKEKVENTMLKNWGVKSIFYNKEFQEKIDKKNIELYGFKKPSQNPEIAKKIGISGLQTRKKKGTVTMIDGKTLLEWAQEKHCDYNTMLKTLTENGEEFVKKYDKKKTYIEQIVEKILQDLKVNFVHNRFFKNSNRKPDFVIEDKKLIIECDGIYWHSDANKKINHKMDCLNKKQTYASLGYSSLFFFEDEIINKPNIIKSIIQNKLGLSNKIFARKTKFEKIKDGKEFFETNHLMGKGAGRIYGLKCNNELVAAIQIKNKDSGIEISRFCTKNGISVVGGFSKLLKYVIETEQPKQIITFIDKRYGDGSYLIDFGFNLKGEHQSFKWTNFEQTLHRMSFKSNSGYEHGVFKLWDCGQAKYVKNL